MAHRRSGTLGNRVFGEQGMLRTVPCDRPAVFCVAFVSQDQFRVGYGDGDGVGGWEWVRVRNLPPCSKVRPICRPAHLPTKFLMGHHG